MYNEPYLWVEAIAHRREYLEEQLKAGSPIVAFPCREGVLMITVSAGTQKLYEIYDRIALGAIGHPADVEKLRNTVLDMAHMEGFNRSPADVTARRLIQFGLAPVVKQAFEEITHAPFIIRLLLADLGPTGRPTFYTLNYDGVFKEESRGALIAPSAEATDRMETARRATGEPEGRSLPEAFQDGLRIWAAGEVSGEQVDAHLRRVLQDRKIEAVLLSSSHPGLTKYRVLPPEQIEELTRAWRG